MTEIKQPSLEKEAEKALKAIIGRTAATLAHEALGQLALRANDDTVAHLFGCFRHFYYPVYKDMGIAFVNEIRSEVLSDLEKKLLNGKQLLKTGTLDQMVRKASADMARHYVDKEGAENSLNAEKIQKTMKDVRKLFQTCEKHLLPETVELCLSVGQDGASMIEALIDGREELNDEQKKMFKKVGIQKVLEKGIGGICEKVLANPDILIRQAKAIPTGESLAKTIDGLMQKHTDDEWAVLARSKVEDVIRILGPKTKAKFKNKKPSA